MTILETRKSKHLTREQVHQMLGIPVRTLQNWETGTRKCPDWCERLIIEKLNSIRKDKPKLKLFGTCTGLYWSNVYIVEVVFKNGSSTFEVVSDKKDIPKAEHYLSAMGEVSRVNIYSGTVQTNVTPYEFISGKKFK